MTDRERTISMDEDMADALGGGRLEVQCIVTDDSGPVAVIARPDIDPVVLRYRLLSLAAGMFAREGLPKGVCPESTLDTAVFALARCLCMAQWPCADCMEMALRILVPFVTEFNVIAAAPPPEVQAIVAAMIEEGQDPTPEQPPIH